MEKSTLKRMKSNQWHYRLIKAVWGNTLPDPKTIRNGCLYFWVTITTLLICPFVFLIKGIKIGWDSFWDYQEERANAWARNWVCSLSEDQVFSIYDGYSHEPKTNELVYVPKKISKRLSTWETAMLWCEKTKGIKRSDMEFNEYREAVQSAMNELKARHDAAMKAQSVKSFEERKIQRELEAKREAREEKIRETMDSVSTFFKFFSKLNAKVQRFIAITAFGLTLAIAFTTILNIGPVLLTILGVIYGVSVLGVFFGNSVVKAAKNMNKVKNYGQVAVLGKRLVGLLLTGFVAVAGFFIIQVLTFIVSLIVLSWNGEIMGKVGIYILIGLGIIGGVLLISVGIIKLTYLAKNQYEYNKKLIWYVAPFVYLGLGAFYVGKYILYYPLYFIMVSCFWNIICVALIWKFVCVSMVYGIAKGFGVALSKLWSVFAEYFGADYNEYCPGLIWDDEKKLEDK